MQATPKSRPTGVTIIAILNIIEGIIMLFGGVSLLAAGIIIPSLPPSAFEDGNLTEPNVNLSGIPPSFFGDAALAIGGVIIAIGIVSLIVAYGLLKGMGWAWTAKGNGMGMDCDRCFIDYKHCVERDFNCHRKYRWNS